VPNSYRCPACRKRLRAERLVLEDASGIFRCPSCGATVTERPAPGSRAIGRVREWLARRDAARPERASAGGRLRDSLAFWLFGFNCCLSLYVCFLAANLSAAALIAGCSYRPIGWPRDGLVAAVILFGIVYFLLTTPVFILLMRRTPRSAVTVFVLVLLAAIPFVPLHIAVVQPYLAARLHLDNWPRDVALVDFRACASEFEHQEFRQRLIASGTIAIEIENRTPYLLEEAVYTVRTGRDTGFWGHNTEYRFVIRDVPAGQRRRFEARAYLGAIVFMAGGGRASSSTPVEAVAKILWDGVRFDRRVEPVLTSVPGASNRLIDDCPGFERPDLPWFRAPWRGPGDAIERMKKRR
jgi:hypothetical protein